MLSTSIEDLQELFRALGVKNADTIMLHSALFTFGKIENRLDGFYHAIRSLIGTEGTIIVPTFTYSFRRGEIFDIKNTSTPPELGVFPEYLRNKENTFRSADPLFSMVAEGPKAEFLMERNSNNCFGNNSIYEKIFNEDTLILALGITYTTGLAGFMHIEKLASVDYRVDTKFTGISVNYDGIEYDDQAIHFARNENKYPEGKIQRDKVGIMMEDKKVSRRLTYGSGGHISTRTKKFGEFVLNLLYKNPHIMFEEKV